MIVSAIGAYFFWFRFASIIMRDNMNYQEYNWYFNPKNAPLPASGTKTLLDPWKSESNAVCMGQACCYQGSVWDSTVNVCVPTNNMQKIEEGFTKYSKIYKKPDVILDEKSIQPFYKELN